MGFAPTLTLKRAEGQKLNRIVAAFDPVLMDSYAAEVLDYN